MILTCWIDAAKHLIEVKTIPFGGSPRFKDDGTEFVPESEDGEEHEAYIGTPRREIDHNWALLHWGKFMFLPSFPNRLIVAVVLTAH